MLTAQISSAQTATQEKEISIAWEKLAPHPRIMLGNGQEEKLKNKLTKNPHMKNVHDALIKEATKMLAKAPAERKLEGRRLLGVSREVLKRVFYWSYAYRMTKDKKFLERAEVEMLKVCEFSDWNPSHFLDVGELCVALGIGYDWLYDDLSDSSKEKIRDALFEKGIIASGKHGWFLRSTNNWNQVCNAGMIYAALALYDTDPDSAKEIISRSIKSNNIAFEVYKPDGNYPEGFGYWEYGSGFQMLMIGALESAFGKNSALWKKEGFLESARYIQFSIGSSGKSFNFSDNGEGGRWYRAVLTWFAEKLKDRSVLIPFEQSINPENPFVSFSRELPVALIYGASIDFSNLPKPKKNIYVGHGANPVAMVRTNWEEGKGLYLGFKGGSASISHAHADAGTFVFDIGEQRWICDVAILGYNTMEQRGIDLWNMSQKSPRWKLIRYANSTHNTLTVNGHIHNVKGKAEFVEVFDTPEKKGAKLDMTAVFSEDLKNATREIAIINDEYLEVVDCVSTGDSDCSVRWNIATKGKVTINPDRKGFTISQNDKKLSVTLESDASFTAMKFIPQVQVEGDEPLKGYELAGFEIMVKKASSATFKATLKQIE